MRAARLLHEAAGCPSPRKPIHDVDARCAWCGETGEQHCRLRDVCGSSFTDHDVMAVPSSPWICVPCSWAMTGRPPDTLRLWSVVYREDREARPSHEKAQHLGSRIHLQNKADPSEMDRILRDPPDGPWICSVADSGQIHVVPFAVVNHGDAPWCVRFERQDVRSAPATYRHVADVMALLYAAGASKDDIASGDVSPSRLRQVGIERWRAGDEYLRPFRGGALFELALFLLRRPSE